MECLEMVQRTEAQNGKVETAQNGKHRANWKHTLNRTANFSDRAI